MHCQLGCLQMRLPGKIFAVLGGSLALSACGGAGHEAVATTPLPKEGPAADYPMVIGEPYLIDGVQYTPADVLNYDHVGLAVLDQAGGMAITGEDRILPVPSYVEVTSLETGRTILVRIERRGPTTGDGLIGLSSGALSQLGASPQTPVRVRRVNPPEQERALLRRGEAAPERIATPMSLVEVLRRKLPANGAAALAKPELASPPSAPKSPTPEVVTPPPPAAAPTPKAPSKTPAKPQEPKPTAAVPKPAQPAKGGQVVQAGAFSVEANARAVARKIDGTISRQGNLFLVRTGPFATSSEASASLAKVKAAGYSGARIYKVE